MKRLHVFLAQPVQSAIAPLSAKALWNSAKGPVCIDGEKCEVAVLVMGINGSLLARNCNLGWTSALNSKYPIDYFAMLHADISADDGWLTKMIVELEEKDLDVLSAVVPLKNPKGLTSTALDGGDEWTIKCRLSMQEVHDLPITFTSDDVGYPLLVNTGCFVCKWGEWAEKVHFEIRDKIIFENGEWQPRVQSEDWNFSRQCNRLGLRIGSTRAIDVIHHGMWEFSNAYPWGSESYDEFYLSESAIKAKIPTAAK